MGQCESASSVGRRLYQAQEEVQRRSEGSIIRGGQGQMAESQGFRQDEALTPRKPPPRPPLAPHEEAGDGKQTGCQRARAPDGFYEKSAEGSVRGAAAEGSSGGAAPSRQAMATAQCGRGPHGVEGNPKTSAPGMKSIRHVNRPSGTSLTSPTLAQKPCKPTVS